MSVDVAPSACAAASASATAAFPRRSLLRFVAAASWPHQLALVTMTVAVFLLEVVPIEIQRRVVNDVVKHRPYRAIAVLCGVYIAAVAVQGGTKLLLNIYRAWVGERAKRDLRRLISVLAPLDARAPDVATRQGTAVSMAVAEVEPVGNFVGISVSEPLLQVGILTTVISYVVHIDLWMGLAVLGLLVPQFVFVPVMQHAMNRRTRARVWLLRQIGAGLIVGRSPAQASSAGDAAARIDSVFRLDMRVFRLKFVMNFLMNLCTHLQIVAVLLLGAWWVMQESLEAGAIVALISAIGRLTDPWGDIVNYFRELSVTKVKFDMLVDAVTEGRATPGCALASAGDPAAVSADGRGPSY